MTVTRAGARAAVAAFFQPPAVAGLNRIYSSFPKSSNLPTNAYTYGQPVGTRSGAVGIVDIIRSIEGRRGIGGAHSGWKRTDYEVEFLVVMRSSQRLIEKAMYDYDAVIDGVVARLRSDRVLGTDGLTAWQAGEGRLEVDPVERRNIATGTELWSFVRFDLVQWNLT